MKIIHTSDWHLGQEFYSYDRNEEHNAFLLQLRDIVADEQPDVLIVSGDIYHNATPSNTVMRLFTDRLDQVRQASPGMQIVVIAGNHDSATRLEISSSVWSHLNVHIIGRIERNENDEIDFRRHIIPIGEKGYVVALPHVFPQNYPLIEADTPREERQVVFHRYMDNVVKEVNKDGKPVVVAAHLAVSGSNTEGHDLLRGNMDFVDAAELGLGYDYLALGHIHCPQNINGYPARYCGTPIPVSFDENYSHSVSIVRIETAGAVPEIRTVKIENPWSLRTLPEEAAPFEKAIASLMDMPDDEKCYVRLNVRIEHHAPADAMEQAHNAVKGKAARFCCFKWEQEKSESIATRQMLDVEQIKQLSPVDVAELYYQETTGEELDVELKDMLGNIVEQIEQNRL